MSIIAKSVEGIEISWPGGSRIIPLLTGDEITKFLPLVTAASLEWEKGQGDAITLPVTVILAAAQRRYPEMTRDDLEENLFGSTLKNLWQELWALSFLNFGADSGPKQ
jgi:hypothetical protein